MTEQVVPLFGEDYCFALLLRMVLQHCATMDEGKLNSFRIAANTEAMLALADAGFIEIMQRDGSRILADLLPAGLRLQARFLADKNGQSV